jgi:apolipoprotein D and lipocalin family protein
MEKKIIAAALAGTALLLGACAYIPRPGPVGNRAVPQPARSVDLNQYVGRWYEQFRYEASFEKGMDNVTATYSLNDDGTVKVVNRGLKPGGSGEYSESVGKARIADTETNAKLKVSFFGPFYGNYWVLDHGDDYAWAIIGEPSGRYLWVLTRAPQPAPDVLASLEARVKELGYDWSLVRVTKQNGPA